MGFFDTIKKGASIAKKGADIAKHGLDLADEAMKKKMARKSDSELREMDSNNKYVREELQKRGL